MQGQQNIDSRRVKLNGSTRTMLKLDGNLLGFITQNIRNHASKRPGFMKVMRLHSR